MSQISFNSQEKLKISFIEKEYTRESVCSLVNLNINFSCFLHFTHDKLNYERIITCMCNFHFHTLFERKDTRPPQRAQNFVWQYEQLWPHPSANFVLWQIPQVGASPFCSCCCCDSSPIFFTCSLYISNCWWSFLQREQMRRNWFSDGLKKITTICRHNFTTKKSIGWE